MSIHEVLQDAEAVAVAALPLPLLCLPRGLPPGLWCLYLELWHAMLFVSLFLPLHWSSEYYHFVGHQKGYETSEGEARLASVLY